MRLQLSCILDTPARIERKCVLYTRSSSIHRVIPLGDDFLDRLIGTLKTVDWRSTFGQYFDLIGRPPSRSNLIRNRVLSKQSWKEGETARSRSFFSDLLFEPNRGNSLAMSRISRPDVPAWSRRVCEIIGQLTWFLNGRDSFLFAQIDNTNQSSPRIATIRDIVPRMY